jgi:hypothetical protein
MALNMTTVVLYPADTVSLRPEIIKELLEMRPITCHMDIASE